MPDTRPDAPTDQTALADAWSALLLPLARLALARGLPYASAGELLKRAFVQAAREAQPEPGAQRMVSRISTATGISRREVTRLTEDPGARTPHTRSHATEVFAHWTTARAYRDRRGTPRVLPRLGPAPSFEALAQSITRDVHPRSLLDELRRLGLATHDPESDTVTLVRDAFVPRGDVTRLLAFLADNVGDHASAAVGNVLDPQRPHFEQALFADELSAVSVEAVRALVRTQWQVLIDALVPAVEDLIDADRKAGRPRDRRLRVGLYSYHAAADATVSNTPAAPARRRAPRKPEEPQP